MTNKRSTNEELQERYEFAAQLWGKGVPDGDIIAELIKEYNVTPQQARTYRKEGKKIFLATKCEGGTVAEIMNLEYFIINDNLKSDRLRAIEAGNLTAVASINKTRIKLLDMGRAMDPGSTSEMELNNYYVQLCKEHIEDKLKPRKGKIPRDSINTGWTTNATEEEIKKWEEKGLDITGLPKLDDKDDIPF